MADNRSSLTDDKYDLEKARDEGDVHVAALVEQLERNWQRTKTIGILEGRDSLPPKRRKRPGQYGDDDESDEDADAHAGGSTSRVENNLKPT